MCVAIYHLSHRWFSHYFSDIQSISESLKCCYFCSSLFHFYPKIIYIYIILQLCISSACMVLSKPASTPHCAKIVKRAWETSDVTSDSQDFHWSHFEIVTSATASIPVEVRAYPERRLWPISQAYIERRLRLDLFTRLFKSNRIFFAMQKADI